MQITIQVDTNSRKDVEIVHHTFGYLLGFLPQAPSGMVKTMTMSEPDENGNAKLTVTDEKLPEAPAPEATKAAVPEPVAATRKPRATKAKAENAPTGDKPTLADARAKLTDYSADSRFGMAGVMTLLRTFGVDRISDLPDNRYGEFIKAIDDALAANPLA